MKNENKTVISIQDYKSKKIINQNRVDDISLIINEVVQEEETWKSSLINYLKR